jgi:hypothetical protein
VDPAAKSAIRASNDVFATYDRGIAKDAVGDELRVFDKVGGVAHDTRHQHLARWQLRLLPHTPLMLVPHVAGLEGIGLRPDIEDQVDDVLKRQVMGVRPVPAAPTQVVAHLLLGNADKRVVDGASFDDLVGASEHYRSIVNPRALAVLGSMTRLLDLTAATGFYRLIWMGHWTATRAVCVWAPLGSGSAPANAKKIIRSLRILSDLLG